MGLERPKMSELKLPGCPFCGSHADSIDFELLGGQWAKCSNKIENCYFSKYMMPVKAWQTRALDKEAEWEAFRAAIQLWEDLLVYTHQVEDGLRAAFETYWQSKQGEKGRKTNLEAR